MVRENPTTDTIARVNARDMLLILRTFMQSPHSTIENVRLRLCHDRKVKRRGTYLWSTARDILSELDRLGYVSGVSSPKTSRHFEEVATAPITLTDEGRELLASFEADKATAYDKLFARMYEVHRYLQSFVHVLRQRSLFAPVISSMKEHVSDRYTSTSILADDVSNDSLDIDSFLNRIAARTHHPLEMDQEREIRDGVDLLIQEAAVSADREELPKFAKMFMDRLNQIVVPALFRQFGIGFDYRTHRTLWSLGEEFRVWCITRSHPDFDGWLVFPTARIEVNDSTTQVTGLVFDSGLARTREKFLNRLHEAYLKLQATRGATYVSIWELRAVFCVENRCHKNTFDRVFAENYRGNDEYVLHLEIQRNKPQHEDVVRAGDRNIGSARVFKK